FPAGGTECNNKALNGLAICYIKRGHHINTTKLEYPLVSKRCEQLEEIGYEITCFEVIEHELIDIEELNQAVKETTILVAIMYVNKEIGSMEPIHEVAKILEQHKKILFHTVAVQSFSKLPINLKGIDLLSISGHKLNGLRGTGVLYI